MRVSENVASFLTERISVPKIKFCEWSDVCPTKFYEGSVTKY